MTETTFRRKWGNGHSYTLDGLFPHAHVTPGGDL